MISLEDQILLEATLMSAQIMPKMCHRHVRLHLKIRVFSKYILNLSWHSMSMFWKIIVLYYQNVNSQFLPVFLFSGRCNEKYHCRISCTHVKRLLSGLFWDCISKTTEKSWYWRKIHIVQGWAVSYNQFKVHVNNKYIIFL